MAKKKGPTPKRKVLHPQARPKQVGLSTRVLLAALVLGGLLIGVSAFAVSRGNDDLSTGARGADAGPVHVHGLGINPADRSLLIATHTGTYRASPNEQKAARISESRQDTMGFTVAGPNHFLGSGHPDVQESVQKNLPPHLGLIESRDSGRTWQSLSLSGEADFHVLRLTGQRVYGYDASNDRLLVSRDRGQKWREVNRPAPLLDLAVDPTDAQHLIAAGEGGLYESSNEGRTWRRLDLRIGLLAWPSAKTLYVVDAQGSLFRIADEERRWIRVANVGGQPAAFLAETEKELYLALRDGTIKQSRDSGRTWAVRSMP
jgi:hypothetical protein